MLSFGVISPEGDVAGKYQLISSNDGESPPSFAFLEFETSPNINYVNSTDISGGFYDGFVGSRSVESSILIDGIENVTTGTGEWAIPFSVIAQEGENTVVVGWNDSVGNVLQEKTYLIYRDTISPEVVSITPTPRQVLTEQFSTFDISLIEQGSGIDANKISVSLSEVGGDYSYSHCNTSANTSQGCSINYDEVQKSIQVIFTTPLDELKNYTLRLEIHDNAGNTQIYDYQYYIDSNYTEVPDEQGSVANSWSVSPHQNYVRGSRTIDLLGTRPPFTTVKLNDARIQNIGVGDWESRRYNLLSVGENVLTFKWEDATGTLVNETEYRLFYDNVEPIINQVSPELDVIFAGDLTEIIYTVEEDSGVDLTVSNFELYKDGNIVLECQGTDSVYR